MELEKFVDELPIPETLTPSRTHKKANYYDIEMREFRMKMHRDLRPARLWGYNGQLPGPIIDVKEGEPVLVKWQNKLPSRHFLPIDKTIHDLEELPEVRTVTHLHGSVTAPESDGYPEAWYTRDYKEVGSFFKTKIHHYPNRQRAATLWYHDHAMGLTRLNVYAGLVGMYIIRSEKEKRLELPSGKYEIPLLLMDRSFQDNGELFYPTQPDDPAENLPDPSIRPFFLGDTNVVNGKVWPYMRVEPRKYRFRLVNAANTRGYQLYLDSGQTIYQIGSDGGLLEKTIPLEQFTIEPAERFDIIIDFSQYEGQTITLKNDLGDDADPDDQTDDVMQFRVDLPLAGTDTSKIPTHLSNIPSLKNNAVTHMRNLKLVGTADSLGRPLLLLDNKMWMDPVTETPKLGATEIWSFINTTNNTHPIHLHLIQYQVLDRQPFDLERYNQDGMILYTGPPAAPAPNERGWKDTIASPGGQITRVIAKFGPFTGDYVWHCHILEHEDYDMMRPLRVIDPNRKTDE